jgi:hypothetical protein
VTTLATNAVVASRQQSQQNRLITQRSVHQSSINIIPTLEDFDSKEHVQAQMQLININSNGQ